MYDWSKLLRASVIPRRSKLDARQLPGMSLDELYNALRNWAQHWELTEAIRDEITLRYWQPLNGADSVASSCIRTLIRRHPSFRFAYDDLFGEAAAKLLEKAVYHAAEADDPQSYIWEAIENECISFCRKEVTQYRRDHGKTWRDHHGKVRQNKRIKVGGRFRNGKPYYISTRDIDEYTTVTDNDSDPPTADDASPELIAIGMPDNLCATFKLLFCRGLTVAQVAKQLGVSASTVYSHRRKIIEEYL